MTCTSKFANTLRSASAKKARKTATTRKPIPRHIKRNALAPDPNQFVHLRPVSDDLRQPLVEEPGRVFAALSEAVTARLENRDPSKLLESPKQAVQRVTGADLIAAGRRAGVIPLKAPR